MSWNSLKEEVAKAQEAQNKSKYYRFNLKQGTTGKIVFIDDEPSAIVKEHVLKLPNNRYDTIVCLEDDCPLCKVAAKDSPVGKQSLVAYFTVIHIGEFEGKQGTKYSNPIRVLPAKMSTIDLLTRQHEKREGLKGAVYEIFRSRKDTSPSVGDQWEFEKKISDSEIKKLNADAFNPIDYNTDVLNRKTAQEMLSILASLRLGGNEDQTVETTNVSIDW